MKRVIVLALILIVTASTLSVFAVKPAGAQSTPNPAVPQFTVKFVNASYNVTTTNPYTGKSQTQQISNDSIQIIIKNQPPNYPSNYQIYYSVRMKPHFGGNWTTELGSLCYWPSAYAPNGYFPYAWYMLGFPTQSNGNYTVIAFSVTPATASQGSGNDIQLTPEGESGSGVLPAIPTGGQLDFQVEALVGHNSTYWRVDDSLPLPPRYYGDTSPEPPQGYYLPAIAYDSNSSWSNTQTVTIGQTSPSVPEFSPLPVAIPLMLSLIYAAVIVRFRKTSKSNR